MLSYYLDTLSLRPAVCLLLPISLYISLEICSTIILLLLLFQINIKVLMSVLDLKLYFNILYSKNKLFVIANEYYITEKDNILQVFQTI